MKHSNEELNNGKASGLIDDGGKKDSADFSLKSKNEMITQSSPPEKNGQHIKSKSNKKAKSLAKIFATFATVASATLLGVLGLNILIPEKASVSAQIERSYTTEDGVYYFVTLDNFKETDEVYVILHNDFTNRSQKVESSQFDGSFENLQKNMYYTLEVKQGNITIASKVVRTVFERQVDEPGDNQNYDPTQGDGSQTDPTQGGDPTSGDDNNDPTGAGTNG